MQNIGYSHHLFLKTSAYASQITSTLVCTILEEFILCFVKMRLTCFAKPILWIGLNKEEKMVNGLRGSLISMLIIKRMKNGENILQRSWVIIERLGVLQYEAHVVLSSTDIIFITYSLWSTNMHIYFGSWKYAFT